MGIKDYQVQQVLQKQDLITINPKEWNDSNIENFVKVPITFIGTGKDNSEIIDIRNN